MPRIRQLSGYRSGLLRLSWSAASAALLGCSGGSPMGARTSVDQEAAAPLGVCERDLGLSDEQCKGVAQLRLPAKLPASAGNRYADSEDAARLGFLVFYDQNFSTIPDVRCATCHLPENGFNDGKPVSEVVKGAPARRNSPSILNAAWSGPFYFWDGRVDSLWSQPLVAFENPDEMNGSRLAIAHALNNQPVYRARYEAIFGPLPPLSDSTRFPTRGRPGEEAFDKMPREDQDAVNAVVANLGKSLEAYIRKVATGPSAFDRYLDGQANAIENSAQEGLSVFVQAGCISCHAGGTFSDGKFHNVETSNDDRGRAAAIAQLQSNIFNGTGQFFDSDTAPAATIPLQPSPEDEGAFRTPTLRNLSLTAPYGHDGRYATLEDVLTSPHGAGIDEADRKRLTVFLLTLNGAYPSRPWSDWPAR